MGASVRIEDEAFSDMRYERLAELAGLADADHARGKMARLWRQCTLEGLHVLPEVDVARVLGPNGTRAISDANLGEIVDGGVRIHGTKGRIEWLKRLRNNGKYGVKGGRPRKASRVPTETQVGSADETPPAPAPAPAPAPIPASQDPPVVPQGDVSQVSLPASSRKPKKQRPARQLDATPAELEAVANVLGRLSARSGRTYNPTTASHAELVLRLLRDGHSETDLRMVVWDRANRWADDEKMAEFLRPSTLFAPTKFAERLAEARAAWEQERGSKRTTEATKRSSFADVLRGSAT